MTPEFIHAFSVWSAREQEYVRTVIEQNPCMGCDQHHSWCVNCDQSCRLINEWHRMNPGPNPYDYGKPRP